MFTHIFYKILSILAIWMAQGNYTEMSQIYKQLQTQKVGFGDITVFQHWMSEKDLFNYCHFSGVTYSVQVTLGYTVNF